MNIIVTSLHQTTAELIAALVNLEVEVSATAQYHFALAALETLQDAWESYARQQDGLTAMAQLMPELADDAAAASIKIRILQDEVSTLIDWAEGLLADAEEELKLDWLLTH